MANRDTSKESVSATKTTWLQDGSVRVVICVAETTPVVVVVVVRVRAMAPLTVVVVMVADVVATNFLTTSVSPQT